MSKLILALCFFLFIALSVEAQVHSTPSGGQWNQGTTWVGGMVPSADSDVVIHGPVRTNSSSCNNMVIEDGGSIMGDSNGTINVNGMLLNSGSIENYAGWGYTTVNIAQNFVNHGTVTANTINFSGAGIQNFTNTGSFNPQKMYDTNPSAGIVMLSDLVMTGVQVDLNNSTLTLNDGSNHRNLTLHGGYLFEAVVSAGTASVLTMDEGAYLQSVTINGITAAGALLCNGGVTIGHLINTGYMSQYGSNSSVTVQTRLDNYGTITSGASFLTIYLYGDLYNYYLMNNYRLDLMSTASQSVYQSENAFSFGMAYLGGTTGGADIQMLSDLRFNNCQLNLVGKHLITHYDGEVFDLTLSGGYLNNTTLETDGYSVLTLNNGAYLTNIAAGDCILTDTPRIDYNVTFQNVVNHGALQPTAQYVLTILGDFRNYGTVANAGGSFFTVDCGGDFLNVGTMSNHQLRFNGSADQQLMVAGTINVSQFILVSNVGNATWYRDGIPSGSGSTITINPFSFGLWQPVGTSPGRFINIGEPGGIEAPANINISVQSDGLLLSWDQVPGAVHYALYSSAFPDWLTPSLDRLVVDPEESDSRVETLVVPSGQHRFYRVTAFN